VPPVHQHRTHRRLDERDDTTMYDLYPDWGPARHRDSQQEPTDQRAPALASVQAGLDLRDNGGERPDDN
jgi:hypothetical protein